MSTRRIKVIFFANTDWYLANFRIGLARYLRDHGADIVMVSPEGPHAQRIIDAGFRWIPIEMARRSLNPFTEAALLWRLHRIYQSERPDIGHHFTIKCVVYGGLIARWHRLRGSVASVDGLGFVFASSSALARTLRPVVQHLMRFALGSDRSRAIVQNPDDLDALISLITVNPRAVRLIVGSGINTEQFCPPVERRNENRKRVVLAARMIWEKGLAEYVEAARQVKASGANVEFLLAGTPDPGNPSSVSSTQLEEWRAAGVVTPLGHVDDMAQLYRSADLAVLPSFYREGIPRSLLEAAATGLPIVTTNAPGCREAVEDGVSGLLVPLKDSTALAAAIQTILDDPARARKMGEAGRQRMLELFDQRIVFSDTAALYRELLGNTDPAWSAGVMAPTFHDHSR